MSAVSMRPLGSPVFLPDNPVSHVDGPKPASQLTPPLLARSQNGGSPGKGQITTTPQFVKLMGKNPALRQVPYANYANSVRGAGGTPLPARPSAVYFQVLSGPQSGTVIDMSKEKYLGKFMSPATKIDLMEYGFGQLGLKKMGYVTIDEFAKANTSYRQSTANGSNTGEMRRALKMFEALGDKAFPNGPEEEKVRVTNLPKAIGFDDLSPWLQEEVRSGRMTEDQAIGITNREAERRRTMPEVTMESLGDVNGVNCTTHTTVMDRRIVGADGKKYVETMVTALTQGQSYAPGVTIRKLTAKAEVFHPDNGLRVAKSEGAAAHVVTKIEQFPHRKTPLPNPPVAISGRCRFSDGTDVPSTPALGIFEVPDRRWVFRRSLP